MTHGHGPALQLSDSVVSWSGQSPDLTFLVLVLVPSPHVAEQLDHSPHSEMSQQFGISVQT